MRLGRQRTAAECIHARTHTHSYHALWYSLDNSDGDLTGAVLLASVCGPDLGFDPQLTVVRSAGGAGLTRCLAHNDDACGLGSVVEYPITSADTYYVVVSSVYTDQTGA